MLKRLGKSEPQIIDFGGINELRGKLQRVAQDPGFVAKGRALAIIRDAESNARNAFDSVVSAVTALGLVAPTAPGCWSDGRPAVGIFILPDNGSPGMLESLCLLAEGESEPGRARLECLGEYLACMNRASTGTKSPTSDKTRMQSLLAGAGIQNPQVGAAARANYFDLSSAAFAQLREFLEKL